MSVHGGGGSSSAGGRRERAAGPAAGASGGAASLCGGGGRPVVPVRGAHRDGEPGDARGALPPGQGFLLQWPASDC